MNNKNIIDAKIFDEVSNDISIYKILQSFLSHCVQAFKEILIRVVFFDYVINAAVW